MERNRFYINKNNRFLFHFDRPDAHTLLLKDDENRVSLKIRYENKRTVYVEGVLFDRWGNRITIDENGLSYRRHGENDDILTLGHSCNGEVGHLLVIN